MKTKILLPLVCGLALVSFIVGRLTSSPAEHRHDSSYAKEKESKPEFWTCSMHPQIKQPDPGKCPICAMDLVGVFKNSGADLGSSQMELSESAIRRSQIRTAPVTREMPTVEVRMVGKIDYDETRLSYITARLPGRLERLFVDYTGLKVHAGDHLVEIYSPELLTAQEELLQAILTQRALENSDNQSMQNRAAQTVQAAREKLLLWDLTAEQVAEIEKNGGTSDRTTLYAPVGGIVIDKEAVEGKYVQTGAPIYTIADLSRVWVQLDAYETDLIWLHFGQDVSFTSEAFPGETFTGKIAFIDPTLNPKTRTVRIRVNMDNPGGKLKPEMFVNALVRSKVLADGKIMSAELAGKWISPMHPEIVADQPGLCPVCGMDLVSAEALGYLPANPDVTKFPLVIPSTAPLITGKRAVVYVAVKDRPGIFEGRVIELGPRAGSQYIVKAGLKEGELVVTHGAFKIDSALQIMAKSSMMNPQDSLAMEDEEEMTVTYATPEAFQDQLRLAVDGYFSVKDAFSQDGFELAQQAATDLKSLVSNIEMGLLKGEAHLFWMEALKQINHGIEGILFANDIEAARRSFEKVSTGLIRSAETLGLAGESSIYVYHCPMAFKGKGADWIQNKAGTENPYYGSRMFTCGDMVREIEVKASPVSSSESDQSSTQDQHNH